MTTIYPRDLHGYGQHPPRVEWPEGGKVALSLVLNFEEGGENNILHSDAASEAFLSEIIGASPWPGQRHWNMETIYEYGARAGFWRLHRLMKDLPVTVYGVASALARAPSQVRAMQDANWEIASHGLKWIEYKDFKPEDEAEHIAEAIQLHTHVTGQAPVGWYTGRASINTVFLAAKAADLKYISDSYAEDLPYWFLVDNRPYLMLPYTLDANDMRFATAQGFNSGDQFYSYLKDSLDCLLEEGEHGFGKMMSVGLHCRLIGRPGRIQALKRFIAYAKEKGGVWFATREQIADYWRETFPYVESKMDLTRMNSEELHDLLKPLFGENTWITDCIHRFEIGPAHNNAEGLSSLILRALRSARTADVDALKMHLACDPASSFLDLENAIRSRVQGLFYD